MGALPLGFGPRHRYIRFRVPSGVLMNASPEFTPRPGAAIRLAGPWPRCATALHRLPPQQVNTRPGPKELLAGSHRGLPCQFLSGVFQPGLRTAGPGSPGLIKQFPQGGVNRPGGKSSGCADALQWMRPALSSCLIHPPADLRSSIPADRRASRRAWNLQSAKQLLAGAVDLVCSTNLGLRDRPGYLPAE